MMENERSQIVWLDDKPGDIDRLIQFVRNQGKFDVSVTENCTEALQEIYADPSPELFVIDLLLDGADNGLDLAKTARQMRPLMSVVAVTEHLSEYSSDIVSSLVKRNYPFDAIWEKDDLLSEDAAREFLDAIVSLCQRECHVGTVVRVEPDYTQVKLRTPKGDEYERFFETGFLASCGIGKAGEEITLVFEKTVHGTWGEVCMRLGKRAVEESEDTVVEEIREIMAGVDLETIREKFGSVMDET